MQKRAWMVLGTLMAAAAMSPLFASCGGGSSGGGGMPLDCAWLASDNCWKMTVDKAASCLPAADDSGTLDANDTMCTYTSGHVVTFASAVALPLPDDPKWNFSVAKNGTQCLHYENTTSGGFSLTVGSETVSEGLFGSMGLAVHCPDGTTYSNSNALALFSCPDGLNGAPGNATSNSDTSFNFNLIGTSMSNGTPIFDCRK